MRVLYRKGWSPKKGGKRSVQTKGIVKTCGFTRGIFRSRLLDLSRPMLDFPREQEHLAKPKPPENRQAHIRTSNLPRKSPEKSTFLSLAFDNAPNLRNVEGTLDFQHLSPALFSWNPDEL